MFARNVSIRLKPNMLPDYTRTFESEILPLLRKQKGFKDQINLSNPGSPDVFAISLWENKAKCRSLQHQYLSRSIENIRKNDRWNAQGSDV